MRSLIALLPLVACGGNDATTPPDAAIPADAFEDTLASTGLCMDRACTEINPEALAYTPQYPFWSDGATKKRWLLLPPGERIDTTDMDHWVFPIGTKVWKEFTRDGKRIETRYITKLKPDDQPGSWSYMAYQWNEAQDGTTAVPDGLEDAAGTMHDIPSVTDCQGCHERLKPSRLLGIGAIQLDFDSPSGVDLDDLARAGKLTTNPPGAASPHYPLPGTPTEKAALSYLHANCGHCHNPTSDVRDMTRMFVRLRVGMLGSVMATPTYSTTVGAPADIPFFENGMQYVTIIIGGNADDSAMIARMNSMNAVRFMPNLGVEMIDPTGQTALRTWINSL